MVDMTEPPPPLAYAVPTTADDRLRRAARVFAWFTLVYGVLSTIAAISNGYSLWQFASARWTMLAHATVMFIVGIPLAIGGLLAVFRNDAGPIVIRAAAAAAIVGNVVAYLVQVAASPGPRGILSMNVGTLATQLTFGLLYALIGVPPLLFCLSFPLRRAA